jgi:tetratricopeptide (TPR) repeat protein
MARCRERLSTRASRLGWLVLLVGVATVIGGRWGSDRVLAAPSIADLLQAYIKNPSGTVPDLAQVGNLDSARDDLNKLTAKFLSAPLPKTAPPTAPGTPIVPILEQRRRNLVAFALDLAGANALQQAAAARRLVEWACFNVRRHMPPNDFDHRWQMAALSLIEGQVDPDALRAHLSHLETQFPDDPRALLGHAIADEQATAPVEIADTGDQSAADFAHARNPSGATLASRMERAAKSFEDLLKVDALRPEASLRLAHVDIGLQKYDQALAALDTVDGSSDDAYTLYLSRLFRGVALEGLNRPAAAQDAYRSALQIGPNAHAATMALATSLFRTGHRDEAATITATLLQRDDPTRDAWWAYWAGDYHLWGLLMPKVREGVR